MSKQTLAEYCEGKNIAIVGNAPFTEELGEQIDACDIVVRFNWFTLQGFEPQLGTEFDMWAFSARFTYPYGTPWFSNWEECLVAAKHRLEDCDSVYWAVPHYCVQRRRRGLAQVQKLVKHKEPVHRFNRGMSHAGKHYRSTGLVVLNSLLQLDYREILVVGYRNLDPNYGYHMVDDGVVPWPDHKPKAEAKVFEEITAGKRNLEIIRHE